MHPILFRFQGYPVMAWVVFALIGAWATYFSLQRDLGRAGIPTSQRQLFFLLCLGAWFGAAHLAHALALGANGFVLYGGIVGVFLMGGTLWLALGWHRRIALRELWDWGALGLAWAMMFGRIGCTFHGCCYGTPSGSFPFGYVLGFDHWDHEVRAFPAALRGVNLHAATLYEAALFAAILFGLYRLRRREKSRAKLPPGVPGTLAWVAYAGGRFGLEFIRLDERGGLYAGLSPSQWVSIAFIALGAAFIAWSFRTASVSRYGIRR